MKQFKCSEGEVGRDSLEDKFEKIFQKLWKISESVPKSTQEWNYINRLKLSAHTFKFLSFFFRLLLARSLKDRCGGGLCMKRGVNRSECVKRHQRKPLRTSAALVIKVIYLLALCWFSAGLAVTCTFVLAAKTAWTRSTVLTRSFAAVFMVFAILNTWILRDS